MATRRSSKKSSKSANLRSSREEKEEMDYFLDSDPVGKRLKQIEKILASLALGKLPRYRKFILNADFDLRNIVDRADLKELIEGNNMLGSLYRVTKSQGFAKVSFQKDKLKFILLYDRNEVSSEEALLFSNSFGQVICATYSAIGIDMRTFPTGKVESLEIVHKSKTVKKSLIRKKTSKRNL